MMQPRLLVLGYPLWSGGADSVQLRRSEAALLAYLGDQAPRSIRRETVASIFWPQTTHRRALRSLSQLHYQVRQKVPGLPWIANTRSIGLQSLPTDVDLLADYLSASNYEAAFQLVRGPFLSEPFTDSEELELWRVRKQGQVLGLLEKGVSHIVSAPSHSSLDITVAKAIDHLIAIDATSKQLLIARVVLHLRQGEAESAKRLHARVCLEYDQVPHLQELAKHLVAINPEPISETPGPFVGRGDEVSAIQAVLDEAKSGAGRVIVLTGEPGIGKTRLATHVISKAALSGFTTYRIQAHTATQRVPCSTLSLLISQLCTNEYASRAVDILGSLRRSADDSSGYTQFEAIRALSEVLESQACTSPLILYIDDTQWVDEATAQFLQYMSVRLSSVAAVIILTLRTSEPDPPPDWLAFGLPSAHRIVVGQLDMGSARQLIDACERAVGVSLTEQVKQSILWSTAGRPLLIAEIIRVATRKGASDRLDFALSMSTEELLRRRFIGLDSDAVWVQGVVAAVGRPLHVAELVSLSGMQLNVVAALTDVLLQRSILEEVGGGSLDFPHDLLRQVAYKAISGPMRALLHRKIADHSIQSGSTPESIAQHLALALDHQNAAAYALQAGRKALREHRYADAEFFHTLALKAPHGADRHEAALALARLYFQSGKPEQIKLLAPHIEASKRGRQGQMFLMLARLAEMLKEGASSIDELLQYARSISDAAVLSNATEFVSIFGSLIDIALDASDRSLGDSIVQDFKRLTLDGDDPDLRREIEYVALLWQLMNEGYAGPLRAIHKGGPYDWQETGSALPKFAAGTILMMAGQLQESASVLTEALDLAVRAHDLGRQSAIRANLGIVLTELGNSSEAQQHLEINLAAPKHGHRLRSIGNLAILMLHQGEHAAAIRYGRSLIAANEHHKSARYSETAYAVIGLAALASGDTRTAREAYERIYPSGDSLFPINGEISYTGSFAAKFQFGLVREKGIAFAILDQSEAMLTGRDRIGLLRLKAVRAELLANSRDETAYPFAKSVYIDSQELGASTIAAQARSIMLRTRA